MSVEMLDHKVEETQKLSGEAFPERLKLLLKHMILSHHGEYEFGSPKLPMTPEAVALHYLDNLDAKLELFRLLIKGDANTETNWTPFQPTLGRKSFKAPATENTTDES